MCCKASFLGSKNCNTCLKDMTLLDSDSNVTIFNNKKLVNNMHPSKQCIKIETNGDVRIESILSCAVPNITYKG